MRKTQKSRQDVSLDEVLNVDSEGNEMVLADILCSEDDQALDEMTKAEDERKLFEAIESLNKKGKGNYVGEVEKTFKITKKSNKGWQTALFLL